MVPGVLKITQRGEEEDSLKTLLPVNRTLHLGVREWVEWCKSAPPSCRTLSQDSATMAPVNRRLFPQHYSSTALPDGKHHVFFL